MAFHQSAIKSIIFDLVATSKINLARLALRGKSWRDIVVMYRSQISGVRFAKVLESAGIAYLLTQDTASKANFGPLAQVVPTQLP